MAVCGGEFNTISHIFARYCKVWDFLLTPIAEKWQLWSQYSGPGRLYKSNHQVKDRKWTVLRISLCGTETETSITIRILINLALLQFQFKQVATLLQRAPYHRQTPGRSTTISNEVTSLFSLQVTQRFKSFSTSKLQRQKLSELMTRN